ncbi:MAG TPA: proline dehydrogenase family protein [Micromonosporaceae bacterium]
MLRTVILAASRSKGLERLVETAPVTRGLVRRFVAGTTSADALRATRELIGDGMTVSLDHLGEDTTTPEHAELTKQAYLEVLSALGRQGLTPATEVSLKLSALGQRFDERLAYEHARAICQAAANAHTTVTLDMEDHTTTDSTLEILSKLRKDFPSTGAVLQAYLRRTEADCRELAHAGSRVRLCKGAYAEPESVAYQARLNIDRSYVRCLNTLLAGDGYPMFATHDARLIAIAEERARWYERTKDSFEYQMLYGVRPDEQRRLAWAGHRVRVYVPYGTEWYPYLVRRLAERPANLVFFLRAMASRS